MVAQGVVILCGGLWCAGGLGPWVFCVLVGILGWVALFAAGGGPPGGHGGVT